MLEIRTNCENCNSPLPNDSSEAMICTYECTFCKDCVETILMNVCPNCGVGLEKRPTRTKPQLRKHPTSAKTVLKPVLKNKFLERYKNIAPWKK